MTFQTNLETSLQLNNKILAICGRAQSGKSTLARLLCNRHKYEINDFADPLKDMLRALLMMQGMSEAEAFERLYGSIKELPCLELCGRTTRHAMQTLGTEWRDMIDKNLWVEVWNKRILHKPKVVVGDMRFPHEFERVRLLGGKVISLIRGEDFSFAPLHESERHFAAIMAQSDLVIVNDMTPLDMLKQVETFLGDWV